MAKVTTNSYPLDSLRSNIGVLESIRKDNPSKMDDESFEFYYDNFIVETLEELGETASNRCLDYCLKDLQKILDKLKGPAMVKPEFIETEEEDTHEIT